MCVCTWFEYKMGLNRRVVIRLKGAVQFCKEDNFCIGGFTIF